MPNPNLTPEQLLVANALLDEIRGRLNEVTAGDAAYLFALRRKVAKELVYDERSKPAVRSALKRLKRREQANICPGCQGELPASGAVLDRFEAIGGYVASNVRLICSPCDLRIQKERRFR